MSNTIARTPSSQLSLKSACCDAMFFSLPLIGFRVVATITSFIGMLMIATLGHRELAASALVTPIQITLNVTGWSVIFAVAIVVGHVFGQGKIADLGKVLRQGWLIGAVLTIPLMIIFWEIGPLLRLFGQDETLVQLVQPFFRVLAFGVLPGMFHMNFIQFITGIGKPKIILYFSMLSIVSVLAIGYPLLFGKFGFPRLGMQGIAYSNVVSMWLACIVSFIYLLINPRYKQFKIFQLAFNDIHYLKQILKIGIPMSVQFVTELLAFSFSAIMVGWINQASLAASQIINQINMIMIMASFSVAQTASVLIGQAQGRGDKHASKIYGSATFLVGLGFAIIIAILYYLLPKRFIGLFSVDITNPTNAATVHIAITLFYIIAVAQIFDSVRNIVTGALRGLKDSMMPMWIGIGAAWIIGIPGGYFLGIKLHGGAPAISFAFLIAWLLATPPLVWRFYHKVR